MKKVENRWVFGRNLAKRCVFSGKVRWGGRQIYPVRARCRGGCGVGSVRFTWQAQHFVTSKSFFRGGRSTWPWHFHARNLCLGILAATVVFIFSSRRSIWWALRQNFRGRRTTKWTLRSVSGHFSWQSSHLVILEVWIRGRCSTKWRLLSVSVYVEWQEQYWMILQVQIHHHHHHHPPQQASFVEQRCCTHRVRKKRVRPCRCFDRTEHRTRRETGCRRHHHHVWLESRQSIQ